MVSAATTSLTVPLDAITVDRRAWPREELDEERVALFAELLCDAREAAERSRSGWVDPLPPLVVVADGQGRYVLADGRHRYEARRRLGEGFDLVSVEVHWATGHTSEEHAYELGLLYATHSAKPLTTAEKRAAISRLLAERPDLSDRAIARLVGVSHRTVGKYRAGVDSLPTERAADETEGVSRQQTALRWEVAAQRLAKDVGELLASCRKLLGGADFKTAGRELYDALTDLYGYDEALVVIEELSAVVDSADAHVRKAAA